MSDELQAEVLRAFAARVRDLLKRLADREVGTSGVGMCAECGGDGIWNPPHTEECELAALLREAEERAKS